MCLSAIYCVPDDGDDVPPGYVIHLPTLFGMGLVPSCVLSIVCTAVVPCSRMCSSCLLLSQMLALLCLLVLLCLLLCLLMLSTVPASAVEFISMLSGKHCVVLLLLLTVRDIRFTIPHPAWDEVHVAL